MLTKDQITGLILAGGRGSRMDHADKGLQRFDGKPLIAHVIERFAPQVGTTILNANRNLEVYRQFGLPVWSDELSGFAGPLAGLQTGLRHCTTPYLATVPCDTPFLPDDLIVRLSNALVAADADVAMAVSGLGAHRRTQPVFSLLKTSLLPHLNAYLDAGNRKVQTWHDLLKKVEVVFEDDTSFRNFNTLDDLRITRSA